LRFCFILRAKNRKKREKKAIFAMLGVLCKKTPSWDGATRWLYPRATPAQWPELEPDTDFSKKKLAVDNMCPSFGAPLRGQAHPGLAGVLQRKGLEGRMATASGHAVTARGRRRWPCAVTEPPQSPVFGAAENAP
jgi:hypothetical protein